MTKKGTFVVRGGKKKRHKNMHARARKTKTSVLVHEHQDSRFVEANAAREALSVCLSERRDKTERRTLKQLLGRK